MMETVNPIKVRQINGKTCCCLASGMDMRSFAHSAVTDYLHDTAFRISPDGTVREFYLNETVIFSNAERNREEVGIVLPAQEMMPLIPFAVAGRHTRQNTAPVLRRLYRLFDCLVTAYKKGSVSEAVFRAATAVPLCLLTDGITSDLTVLPPRLVECCVTADSAAALHFHYPWVHPDGRQAGLNESAVFFLAAAGYACMTGTAPFNGAAVPFAGMHGIAPSQERGSDVGMENAAAAPDSDAEQLMRNMRDGVYIPVELREPLLTAAFARLINRGLTVGKTTAQSVPPLFEQLCAYRDESLPFFSAAVPAETQRTDAQTALAVFIKKKGARISRKRFLIRNQGRLAAAAAGGIVLIAVAAGIILHIRKPPETAGLSAAAVVQGFYTAVGALDQVNTGMYTKNKAGTEYESLMTHLFVTEKMREAYERKKIYYSPEEFLQLCNAVQTAKQPVQGTAEERAEQDKAAVIAMLNGGAVYGISGLTVTPAPQPADGFDVTFYYWLPLFSAEKTEELINAFGSAFSTRNCFPVQICRYQDRVRVVNVNDAFFIGSIEPLERTVITESSDEVLDAYFLSPEPQRPAYLQNGNQINNPDASVGVLNPPHE